VPDKPITISFDLDNECKALMDAFFDAY